MGAIATMVRGNGQAEERPTPVGTTENILEQVLAALLGPVADDLDVKKGEYTATADGLTVSAVWHATPRDGRVRPFVIAYRNRNGGTPKPWRLERWQGGSIVEQVLLMGDVPRIAVNWERPQVREFVTRRMAPAKAAGARVVIVLAGWDGDGVSEADEPQALVIFDSWAEVKALHALVHEQHRVRTAGQLGNRLAGLRVLGASIEVDTPKVRAWRVEVIGELEKVKASLGDGVLLSEWNASSVQCGEELQEVTLEVRDDGILLVKSYGGFATIDLTALAAESE